MSQPKIQTYRVRTAAESTIPETHLDIRVAQELGNGGEQGLHAQKAPKNEALSIVPTNDIVVS